MKETLAALLAALFLGAVWAGLAIYHAQARTQPIAYNHQKHIAAGLECSGCHAGIAEARARAGIPRIDTCLNCHGDADENPKTAAIREYAARKEQIPWKQVYRVPDHVYFSHQRHVGLAKLDCATCHGDMASKATPVSRPAVAIRMGSCMECHERRGVTNDCLACHR